MKKVLFALTFAWAALCFTACEKDDPAVDNASGLNSRDCEEQISVEEAGSAFPITFDAKGAWTIDCAQSWVTITPLSGEAGSNTVSVTVEANSDPMRSAAIHITVEGFNEETLTLIRQKGTDKGSQTLNEWIDETMSSMYLWPDEWASLNLLDDESVATADAYSFLMAGVQRVDANFNHINIEDGGWGRDAYGNITVGQGREYFSTIEQSTATGAPATRPNMPSGLDATELQGFGFYGLIGMNLEAGLSPRRAVAIMSVYPDSPAAEAGLHRGSYITKINGQELNRMNWESLTAALQYTSGSIEVTTRDIMVDEDGLAMADETGVPIFSEEETEHTLVAGSYPNRPFFYNEVLNYSIGGRTVKIGYLAYWQFIMAYDEELLEIFQNFKNEGIDELVLDLRYNGGGVVMSSTMLATLIAGEAHRDEIFSQSKYNDARVAKDSTLLERGIYRIGNRSVPDGVGEYELIERALGASLGLDHIYVVGAEDTASASEMLINGLRGLGIDVRLVGQRTHGKNVGMEVLTATRGSTEYSFRPVTFRSTNCKDEGDYADGFVPDVDMGPEDHYAVFDYGNRNEIAFQWILAWISSGSKPSTSLPAVRSLNYGESLCIKPQPNIGALTLRNDLQVELAE